MYQILHHPDKNSVEISSQTDGVYAKIHLDSGGSLQELILNKTTLIKAIDPLTYSRYYASSVLFPFANRIKDGTFKFNNKTFQLDTNNKEERNALHGLVYNKLFTIKSQAANPDSAHLILEYDYDKEAIGFPFSFSLQLKYTFKKHSLDLNVLVKNKSEDPFPFTIGWHPYFYSKHLNDSSLYFKSCSKLNIKERKIGYDLQSIPPTTYLKLGQINLDDCWQLEESEVVFKTPDYTLYLSSSEPQSFLQVYTPPKTDAIAIEPTTGGSNSFNTKIGLKTLMPKTTYNITWSLKLKTDSNKQL